MCEAASSESKRIAHPAFHHPPPNKKLSPAALHEAVSDLNNALLHRKGPWTVARGKALALDDKARVFQDKGRIFQDRSALAQARTSKSSDRSAMVAYDRSQLIDDRARLLEDKAHLFSDKAKVIQGEERSGAEPEPDVPADEMPAVR
eukprot:CAMPEP_0172167924 /NCGR_PEP_ID=MMETSP1050-20130122/9844_1 /TAXON_ID=233186 /ORGANISM="Cryptomonas curvata, Strain CCAP979/52" /LENGTH=146 /DNA_ID=CAMNT_0012838773 /DNA_START=112 /DNA_END=548 /DNA_ORIENTATION=-